MKVNQGRGVTLVEMLVVVGIIAVLAAIIYPIVLAAREKSNEAKCLNNHKQLQQAVSIYIQNHDDKFPKELFWQSLDVPSSILKDPSDPLLPNGYVFNSTLLGRPGSAVKDSVNVVLFADGHHEATQSPVTEQNLAYGPDDIDFRHNDKTIITFADGHSIISKDMLDMPVELKGAPAVDYVDADDVTSGNFWLSVSNKYVYGSKGYVLCAWNNAASGAVTALNASYVSSVIPGGTTDVTWAPAPSSDPRAVVNPATNTRAASAWQGDGTYTITLANPADKDIHTLHMLCLDFERKGLIVDFMATNLSGKPLMKSPARAAAFEEGVWLHFRFRGSFILKAQSVRGSGAAVSAFAFD